jgi:FkbM family methyltransferase
MTNDSHNQHDPRKGAETRSPWRRFFHFLRKPGRQQYRSLATRLQSRFPSLPIPIRLPSGAWYLVGYSEVDYRVLFDRFEPAETQFIQRYLRPGMTVLDVGAHHGFYSLIASRAVRPQGAVHSFEPAPRERARLKQNLRLNQCTNVSVHGVALGASRGTGTLFQAQSNLDGCNSLRPQEGVPACTAVEVDVVPLDQLIRERGLQKIDFIKMDVEGAELSILQGASGLLDSVSRPVVLAEVSDLRTRAWGYRAVEILRHLEIKGFRWFDFRGEGRLVSANTTLASFDLNLVAVPPERLDSIRLFQK